MAAASTDQNFTEELGAIEQCKSGLLSIEVGADDQGSESCLKPREPQPSTRSFSIRRRFRSDSSCLCFTIWLSRTPCLLFFRQIQTRQQPALLPRWTSSPASSLPRRAVETATMGRPTPTSFSDPTMLSEPRCARTAFLRQVLYSRTTDGRVSNSTRCSSVGRRPTMSRPEVDLRESNQGQSPRLSPTVPTRIARRDLVVSVWA